MKRILVALGLLFLGSQAWAQCTSNSGCATTPCRWAAAGTWTNGAGCVTPPTGTEPWTIQAGHTVLTDAATETGGVGTVAGTLYFDPGTASRDASGFRNLVITNSGANTGITCTSTGKIVLRNSDRLRFDSTAGVARIAMAFGCTIDWRGTAFDTTLTAVSAADDDAAPCGNATTIGREWTITPAAGIALAKAGRRVIFKSGPLKTHHYEIVAVGASTITLCSHLADGSSLGQRLTPYGTAPGSPPGPGTAGHHSTPTVTSGNDSCTGAGAPHPCCSGAAAGNCVDGPDPTVGDAIAIVDDFWIDQSAGTNGFNFAESGDGTSNCNGSPCVGLNPFPIIQYGNLSGFGGGGAGTGVTAATFSAVSAAQFIPDVIGNNMHGFKSDYGPVWRGVSDMSLEWNAVHDSQRATGSSDAYCQFNVHQMKTGSGENGFANIPNTDVNVRYNIAWRTKQCAIQINDNDNGSETHADFQAQRVKVNDNLIYQFCAVASGNQCEAIQLNSCRNCQVRRNVVYDGQSAGNNTGSGIKLGGTASNDGSDVSDNWITGLAGLGIRCDDDQSAPTNFANCQKAAFVNNYISHTRDSGGRGGRWYSNVVKNFALDNSSGAPALRNPVRAYGVFLGVDAAVAATTLCTATANRCGRSGLSYGQGDGNRNSFDVIGSDIICGPHSENAGASNRYCVDNAGMGTQFPAEFDGTFSHVTHDNKATGSNGYAKTFNFDSQNLSAPATWTMNDLLVAYKADDAIATCSTALNLSEVVGRAYSLQTDATFESGGVVSSNCTNAGTVTRVAFISWANRDAFNYGVTVGTPEYTGASDGGAMGARAFRFSADRMDTAWGGTLTFDNIMPVNFSTGSSNADTDGDGVMDLHDNCDTAFNPAQYDPDDDGKGCVCDSGETCA